MKAIEDLFDRALTPDDVLRVLRDHVGAENGLTATQLVRKVCGVSTDGGERRLRSVIEQLRLAGHPVAADPAAGYHLAANDSELDAACDFLLSRAMTTLKQIAAMKKVAMPDLRGQLRLPLNPENDPCAS